MSKLKRNDPPSVTTHIVLPRLTGAAIEALRGDDPEAAVSEERAAELFPQRSASIDVSSALIALVEPSKVRDPANSAAGFSRIGSGKLDLSLI